MRQCAFTICAKNYIGLAKVLENSFKKHNPQSNFYIFISDVPDQYTPILQSNIIVAKDVLELSDDAWIDQSFKYTLTEFCTAIKPLCFSWLLKKQDYEKVIYLDPDIYCFSSFQTIFDNLNNYSIVLAPHILTIEQYYTGDLWENLFLWAGSFNLGFLAVRNDERTEKMLKWWGRVLDNECFIDNKRFTATDQKWMVFLPMFFDRDTLYITRDKGVDAAPWNFYEREFYMKNNSIWVKNRLHEDEFHHELKFVHFSNYKYSELSQGVIKHYSLKNEYADLALVFELYVGALKDSFMDLYLPLGYTYNTFDNGVTISLFNRRIYRRLKDEGEFIGNPFITYGDSFFRKLKKHRLVTKTKAVTTLVRGGKGQAMKYSKTLVLFDGLCWIVKQIVGIDRYEKFLRFAADRLTMENQTYLYDRKSRLNR